MIEELTTLLTGPFAVAQAMAIASLDEQGHENKKVLIKALSNKAQSTFISRIVTANNQITLDAVPFYLNIGLSGFYKDFQNLFPTSFLPPSVWDRLPKWVFFFPADAEVNWTQLLDLYTTLWRHLPKSRGRLEKEYLQMGFGFTCRALAFQRLPYDTELVSHYAMEMGNFLGEYYRELLFRSLERYDKPPLKTSHSEVREMIAIFREKKLHTEIFMVPFFGQPGDELILPLESYTNSLDTLLKLYEAKEDRLLATIKREADSFSDPHEEKGAPKEISSTSIESTSSQSKRSKKQKPSGNSHDNIPTLFVLAGAQEKLLSVLTAVLEDQKEGKENLKYLLEGKKINGVIKVKCSLSALTWVFRDAHKAGDLNKGTASIENTGAWLVYWFERRRYKGSNDQWVKLTIDTVLDCLGKKAKKPPKDALAYR